MSPELKCIISDNKGVIDTLTKETQNTQPVFMVKALNDFRIQVNAAITKLIEDPNETSIVMEEDDGNSDNDEDIVVSPKKRKK